jgi:hypothetical protein
MYVSDFICTYKNQSSNYNNQLPNLIEDDDDDDTLYHVQFLQIFGCDECGYNDDKITDGLIEVRHILESHKEGKAFLEKAFELGLPQSFAIFAFLGGGSNENKDKIMDTILRTYYGWNTMDVIHSFVSKIKNGMEVTSNDWKIIIKQYRELYGF